MKIHRQHLLFLFLVSTVFLVACAPKQQPQTSELPAPQENQLNEEAEPLVATESSNLAETEDTVQNVDSENLQATEESTLVDDFLKNVLEEATLLRTDGARLLEEDNLEEARQTYDAALNVILASGLALDAHPELADLFKEITREVVRVEDKIAELENGIEDTPLVDELESIEIESEVLDAVTTESSEEEAETKNEVTFDLPVVQNARVDYFIKKFTTSHRDAIAAGIKRSGQFIERFREILKEEGVPQDLVYLAMIESTFKVRAFSRAKAKGIWQFMSWTGKRYGLRIDWWVDERSDPYKACRAAARYLKDLHNDLGDWLLAMAAYNGGPGRVGRAVKRLGTTDFWTIAKTRHLRRETRNFVPSILAAATIMKQPELYGFDEIELDKPWEYDTVAIDSPIDLRIIAELADINTDDIRNLNPALRRLITPQKYDDFVLRVPKGAGEKLTVKLAELPADKRLKYAEHPVRRGDTLSVIGKRYGASVQAIMSANNISDPRRLRPGQVLIVPLSPGYKPRYETPADSYTQGEKLVHTVRRGDSLYKIALRYGTSVNSIAAWNKMDVYKPIHPGDKLTVYARTRAKGTSTTVAQSGDKTFYTVKQGDTLYDIAIRYKTTVTNLKQWNNLSRNLIKPGDRLTLYLRGSSD
jgi:membrane-bound lytic murein transglycosylase D